MFWAGANAEATVLGKWRKTCDLTQFTKNAASAPVGFNTLGWNSTYTRSGDSGRGDAQSGFRRRWQKFYCLSPKSLYEIGCGTGMLLMQIAPTCDRYVAIDFAPAVLAGLSAQLRKVQTLAERVQVIERTADNFDGTRSEFLRLPL